MPSCTAVVIILYLLNIFEATEMLTIWAVTIFVVTTCVIFSMPNKVFAWFEYFTSLIKIVLFMLIILLSLAIVCGAGPKGYVHHGSTWTDFPPFKNGFSVRTACPKSSSMTWS